MSIKFQFVHLFNQWSLVLSSLAKYGQYKHSNLVVVSETINAHNMWLTKNNNIKSKINTFNSFSWWISFLFVLNWKENYRIIIKKKSIRQEPRLSHHKRNFQILKFLVRRWTGSIEYSDFRTQIPWSYLPYYIFFIIVS